MIFNVSVWLTDIGLPEYIDTFRDQGIDELTLRELTDTDLRELGVLTMGHRKTILRETAKLAGEGHASASPSPAPTITPQTIFLSYAHKSEQEADFDISEDLVLLIQLELEKDGHTVWIDKDGIRAGSQWRERITSAILDHAHFLSFLSVRSVRDPGVCLNEISIALGVQKSIQTVLSEAEKRVAPPLTISHIQWHDFQDWREIREGSKTGPNGEVWDAWFAQRMSHLRGVLTDVRNARAPGELQTLREILEPRTFEARIVEKTQGFHGRRWLFEEVQRWLEGSVSRMFWLKAGPGIGKSAFAAQFTHQVRSTVVGFFMCDFQGRKDPEESAKEAVCTLAFQIASRLPDYRLKLLHAQRVDREKILKRTSDELFEYLITEPLNRSGKIPESIRLCLVIDGLDEAGRYGGGNALAELLAKHAAGLPEWLGLLVTSRPEPYLEQSLSSLSGVAIDAQSSQNQQDLIDWIDARLPADIQGQRREHAIAAILEKSGGTFLYLNLVEKEKMLENVDPARLPDKLDGFFKQTLSRYFPDIARYGHKTEPFLRLMVAAPGPLPASMGAEILCWDRRDLMLNVTEPMGSLLKERDGGWVFFHASLSDWLQDPLRSGEHCVNDGGHALLGQFIWNEFAKSETSEWQGQLLDWLAELAPHSGRWADAESLIRGAAFLESKRRFMPARGLRKRVLMLCGDGTELRAAALEGLADNYTESAIGDGGRSNFDHAIELLKSAWEIRGKVHGPDHPLTLMSLAKIPYGEAGLYREGRRALETVLEHSQSLSAGEIRKVQAHYAYYLYEGGEFRASREIYQRLLEMCAHASVERATALSLVGFIEYELGHWDESMSFCEQALAELDDAEASPWPIHLDSTIKLNLAMCLSALGRHDDARTQAIDAEAGFSTVMTESYPWWGAIWLNMGLIMLAGGHLEEAARLADKAAAVSEAGLGEEHYEPTCAWMLQAWFSIRDLHLEKATTMIDRAIRVRGQTLPPGHWRTLAAQENLAFAWRSHGRVDRVDAIVLGWAADLPEEFPSTLSLEKAVRMTCRISESLWRAGHGERAQMRLSPAIERCRAEGRFDVASRLLSIQQQMERRSSHG